jgi:hypothetical protein
VESVFKPETCIQVLIVATVEGWYEAKLFRKSMLRDVLSLKGMGC